MNVATVLVSDFNEDLYTNLAWTVPLKEKYGNDIYIASRSNNSQQITSFSALQTNRLISINSLHDSPYINMHYDIPTQKKLESWLNIPIAYLLSLDWRFFDRKRNMDSRKGDSIYDYMAILISFIKDFFAENKIEILVTSLEISPLNLISYYIAKKLEIPIVTMVSGRFPENGIMFCREDFSTLFIWNEDKDEVQWGKILSLYPDIQRVQGGVDVGKYWDPLNAFEHLHTVIGYTTSRQSMLNIWAYEKYLMLSTPARINRIGIQTLRKILNSVFFEQLPSGEDFFFFPLHYEDDSQLTLREPFMDQFKLVDAISRSLPQQTYVYVKPHPYYVGTDVRSSDLQRISKLKNVRILDPSISAISLIKSSVGVITINSTTGFEAMIHEKPVISFGHDFYCRNDLCYLIQDMNELPIVITKVLRDRKPIANTGYIESFVKTIYQNTVFTEGQFAGKPRITSNDGVKIADALNKVLTKIQNGTG